MEWFLVLAYLEPAAGLVVAAIATVIATRRRGADSRIRRTVAAVAVLLALAVLVFWHRALFWPLPWFSVTDVVSSDPHSLRMVSYLLPLTLGVALVIVLASPSGLRSSGRATLEPRGLHTVTRPWWIAGVAIVLAAWIGLALAAGLASVPDDDGHYVFYEVRPAAEFASRTTIYGWYFSVPSAVGVATLLVVAVAALIVIARMRLRGTPDDGATRLHRARDVVAVTGGGLLLLLGEVLGSLSGTASMTMQFATGTAGMVHVVPSFAALGPALSVSGQIVTALGFALWWFVPLAALRARRLPESE